jgi:hypothetical protein
VLLGRSATLLKLLSFAIIVVLVLAMFNTQRGRNSNAKGALGSAAGYAGYTGKLERDSSFYGRILQGYGRTRRKDPSDNVLGDRMA